MIEYKQWDAYWNNFNNGDEALFQDASLPRDTFWFKIRNWIQTQKQDWRTSTNNRYLDQCIVRWARTITWSNDYYYANAWYQINLYMDLKGKINIPNYTKYDWNVITSDDIEKSYETYTKWSLGWQCKDWRLIIPEDWSYFINYYVEFLYSNQHILTDSYKNLAILSSFNKNWAFLWAYHLWNMPRLNTQDNCGSTTLQDLKKWEQLWIMTMHSKNNEVTLVAWTLIIMKLS